jgi:hypothetical protein
LNVSVRGGNEPSSIPGDERWQLASDATPSTTATVRIDGVISWYVLVIRIIRTLSSADRCQAFFLTRRLARRNASPLYTCTSALDTLSGPGVRFRLDETKTTVFLNIGNAA